MSCTVCQAIVGKEINIKMTEVTTSWILRLRKVSDEAISAGVCIKAYQKTSHLDLNRILTDPSKTVLRKTPAFPEHHILFINLFILLFFTEAQNVQRYHKWPSPCSSLNHWLLKRKKSKRNMIIYFICFRLLSLIEDMKIIVDYCVSQLVFQPAHHYLTGWNQNWSLNGNTDLLPLNPVNGEHTFYCLCLILSSKFQMKRIFT